jgi:PKD domain
VKFALPRSAAALRPALLAAVVGWVLVAPSGAQAALSVSFSFSPASPLTGETVTFSSSSTGVVEPQLWDLDGDGACDDATGPSAERSFPTAGTYTVRLCVTDGVDENVLKRTVTVQNRPPTAAFTYAPASPFTGDSVLLTSTSLDADGPIASLAWDLDNDGAFDNGSGVSASVSFPSAGTYTVKLAVSDRDGAAAIAAQTIAVADPPPELLSPFPIVRLVGTVTSKGTRIRSLTAEAPDGATVRIECRGRGCPFRSQTRAARNGRAVHTEAGSSKRVRIRRLRRRTLRPGAVLEVWITKQGTIGKYTRFRIRKRKAPRRTDLCVMPGGVTPVACPSA